MNKINSLIEEIKDLEDLIKNGKQLILDFPNDKILAFSVLQYEPRLRALRQELRQLKKEVLTLEAA
jgi:phage host-nuclease inhibitor protein Gam